MWVIKKRKKSAFRNPLCAARRVLWCKARAKRRTFAASNLNDFHAARVQQKTNWWQTSNLNHSVVALNWFKMADPEDNQLRFLFYTAIRAARRRRLMAQSYLCHNIIKIRPIVICAIILLTLSKRENATIPGHPRSNYSSRLAATENTNLAWHPWIIPSTITCFYAACDQRAEFVNNK